jgi:hypothetical protein
MKAKLFASLVLFFALSFAAWSYSPGQAVEAEAELTAPEWPELPSCAGRDRGDASLNNATTNGQALTQRENPVETAFVELTCLLAAN